MITAGLGIHLVSLAVYIARTDAFADGTVQDKIRDFSMVFLRHSLAAFIAVAFLMMICSVVLMKREGRRILHLLGPAFFGVCIVAMWLCAHSFFFAMLALYGELFFLGSTVMSYAAALNRPRLDNDYLIILGCYIGKKKKLLPLLRMRLNRAIKFAWEQEIATGKAIKYVPTGGQGSDEIMSEGSAMEMYLLSHGAEQYEIIAEKEAVNTYENFLLSKRLIEERSKDAVVSYITTNYHVLRSGILAKRANLPAEGLAAPTKWYYWPNALIREFIAITLMFKMHHIIAAVLITLLYFVIR